MNREQIDTKYHRQLDIIHPDRLAMPITIVGAGASGSYTALAKMGCGSLTVFDHDLVEEHNQPNQIYGQTYLGMNKAEALSMMLLEMEGLTVDAHAARYVDQPLGRPGDQKRLVISCVDSMAARRDVWEQVKAQGSRANTITLIDPRQGGEFIVVYTATSHGDLIGAQEYEESLHPAGESLRLPCTARAVIYNSMFTGTLVAVLVKKLALGERLPRKVQVDCSGLALAAE